MLDNQSHAIIVMLWFVNVYACEQGCKIYKLSHGWSMRTICQHLEVGRGPE